MSNAATGFLDGATTLLGPVLGSLIGLLLGVPALLVVTGAAMVAAGVLAGRLPTAAPVGPAVAGGAGRAREYLGGARQLSDNPWARLVALLGSAQTMVRGALTVIVVVFAIEVLRTGDAGVGGLYGALGLGALVGLPVAVLVVGRFGVHQSLAIRGRSCDRPRGRPGGLRAHRRGSGRAEPRRADERAARARAARWRSPRFGSAPLWVRTVRPVR